MHGSTLDASHISLIKHIFGRCNSTWLDISHEKVKQNDAVAKIKIY